MILWLAIDGFTHISVIPTQTRTGESTPLFATICHDNVQIVDFDGLASIRGRILPFGRYTGPPQRASWTFTVRRSAPEPEMKHLGVSQL
jgi:hypothetical protein